MSQSRFVDVEMRNASSTYSPMRIASSQQPILKPRVVIKPAVKAVSIKPITPKVITPVKLLSAPKTPDFMDVDLASSTDAVTPMNISPYRVVAPKTASQKPILRPKIVVLKPVAKTPLVKVVSEDGPIPTRIKTITPRGRSVTSGMPIIPQISMTDSRPVVAAAPSMPKAASSIPRSINSNLMLSSQKYSIKYPQKEKMRSKIPILSTLEFQKAIQVAKLRSNEDEAFAQVQRASRGLQIRSLIQGVEAKAVDLDTLYAQLSSFNLDSLEELERLTGPRAIPNYGEIDFLESIFASVVQHLGEDENFTGVNIDARERLHRWFHNLRRIGTASVNGVALTTEIGDGKVPSKLAIIKMVQRSDEIDGLMHEAAIGVGCLNKLRRLVPHFSATYGSFNASTPFFKHNLATKIVEPEVVNYASPHSNPPSCAIYEYISGIALAKVLTISSVEDLIHILFQVTSALLIAFEECAFTHYDLHAENVMMRNKPMEAKYLEYLIDGVLYRSEISSRGVPTIIDYGTSYARNSKGDFQMLEHDAAWKQVYGLRLGPNSMYDVMTLFSVILQSYIRAGDSKHAKHVEFIVSMLKPWWPDNKQPNTGNVYVDRSYFPDSSTSEDLRNFHTLLVKTAKNYGVELVAQSDVDSSLILRNQDLTFEQILAQTGVDVKAAPASRNIIDVLEYASRYESGAQSKPYYRVVATESEKDFIKDKFAANLMIHELVNRLFVALGQTPTSLTMTNEMIQSLNFRPYKAIMDDGCNWLHQSMDQPVQQMNLLKLQDLNTIRHNVTRIMELFSIAQEFATVVKTTQGLSKWIGQVPDSDPNFRACFDRCTAVAQNFLNALGFEFDNYLRDYIQDVEEIRRRLTSDQLSLLRGMNKNNPIVVENAWIAELPRRINLKAM